VTVALVADTHNLLRPELLAGLAGVDRILHLGDVCTPEVLERLQAIAPVEAVRGNCDGSWAAAIPHTRAVDVYGKTAYMVHIRADLDVDPATSGIDYVFFGHSHQPCDEVTDGVRYFNPGSAGPRRFSLPITFALIRPDGALELREIEA